MAACANRHCRRVLSSSVLRSRDSSGFCTECGDLVYAFRPDREKPSDWYLVSEDRPIASEFVVGDQCEGCGLSEFQVVQVNPKEWEAVCRGQWVSGVRQDGCGARHPVRMKKGCEVVWPSPA